jgi:hypothetical protein
MVETKVEVAESIGDQQETGKHLSASYEQIRAV